MKNSASLMKQAQQMQAKMAEMQAQLESVEMTGAAGGGMVKVTVNGKGEVKSFGIDKEVRRPGGSRGAGRPVSGGVQRRQGEGQFLRRSGDAEADRRARIAGRHETAVLRAYCRL